MRNHVHESRLKRQWMLDCSKKTKNVFVLRPKQWKLLDFYRSKRRIFFASRLKECYQEEEERLRIRSTRSRWNCEEGRRGAFCYWITCEERRRGECCYCNFGEEGRRGAPRSWSTRTWTGRGSSSRWCTSNTTGRGRGACRTASQPKHWKRKRRAT